MTLTQTQVSMSGKKTTKVDFKKPGVLAMFTGGILLFILSFPVLWNNERKQVKQEGIIIQARKACVDIEDINNPKSEQNYKLVHVSGQLKTDNPLTDDEFGISLPGTIKLYREVMCCQWVEIKPKSDDDDDDDEEKPKVPTYEKKFLSELLNSGGYVLPEHQNPDTVPFIDKPFTTDTVRVGGFVLSQS